MGNWVTMETIVQILELVVKYGLPTMLVVGYLIFYYTKQYPESVRRHNDMIAEMKANREARELEIKENRAARLADRDTFLNHLEKRDALAAAAVSLAADRNAAAWDRATQQLTNLGGLITSTLGRSDATH